MYADKLGKLMLALCVSTSVASAADWFPHDVRNGDSGSVISYLPLEKASKPWRICVLFPHMKDSYFTAIDYGLVDEARRENVNVAIYEAGGYDQLPKQLSQFDDCLQSGFDAIIVAAISEAGLKQKLQEAADKKIPVIAAANPIMDAPVAGRVYSSFNAAGAATGEGLLMKLDGEAASVVTFPGPQGSGWAEALNDGFLESIKDSKIVVLDQKFGDAGVSVQQALVQDALQTYPDMNVIWGTAPTAEAAIGAVAEAGRDDITIVSSYENQAMLAAMQSGDIYGFATAYPLLNGRLALDMAVRALEGKLETTFINSIPRFVSQDTIKDTDLSLVFAPADFTPIYSVEAK